MAEDVAGRIVGMCFLFVILPAAQALVCQLTARCLRSVPSQYRLQEPEKVWLLMIPLFNLYWNFKVFPALAESYQAYFYSRGVAQVEDCGEQLARWYCICSCLWVVPCLNGITAIASLVLIILFLVRAHELRNRISLGGRV